MSKKKITIAIVMLLLLVTCGYGTFSFVNKESKFSLFSIINKTENHKNDVDKDKDNSDKVEKEENKEENNEESEEEISKDGTNEEETVENDTGYVSPIDTGSINGINADKLKEFILGKYPVNFYGAEMLNSSEYYTETGELTLSDGTFILCEFDQDKSGSEVYDIRISVESSNRDKVKEVLSSLASINYDGFDGDSANKWVKDNYDKIVSKKIGKRNFSLSNNELRYTLTIN